MAGFTSCKLAGSHVLQLLLQNFMAWKVQFSNALKLTIMIVARISGNLLYFILTGTVAVHIMVQFPSEWLKPEMRQPELVNYIAVADVKLCVTEDK